MYILGISAYYHDSAAALIKGEEIVAAAQEERFTRKKHDPSFPHNAIEYCLEEAGITLADVDYIAYYEKPFLKFERLLETYIAFAPFGFKSFCMAMPLWIKEKLFLKDMLLKELVKLNPPASLTGGDQKVLLDKAELTKRILFNEHHMSHAASAYYPSPFEDAAILTTDGVGEWTTTSLAHGKGNEIKIIKEIKFPHSLGLLYSAFTYYTGFKVNSGEYKVMGLAPYGEPKYVDLIKDNLISIKDDGSFHLDMSYFDYATGLTMTNDKFHKLFGGPPRKSESEVTQKEMDLAKSVQVVTEEVMQKLARYAQKETGSKNLCLAGGVALNCVSNGKILREKIFENMWLQPAAGDAGGAVGAAYAAYYQYMNKQRTVDKTKQDKMKGSYLGPQSKRDEIKEYLDSIGAKYQELNNGQMPEKLADLLASGKVAGWHQGRMEFGPRALGGRSIIGDPQNTKMQSTMNLKIKYRESFRPFAPSVLREKVSDYFEMDVDSPYMLLVAPVAENKRIQLTEDQDNLFGIQKLNIPRSSIPAVTHVDYSARVQTIHEETNPKYYELIKKFEEKSGCPVIVNTSFNVRGEPIVCTPEDSYKCFMRTEMDVLVIEDFLMLKEDQPDFKDSEKWQEKFELD